MKRHRFYKLAPKDRKRKKRLFANKLRRNMTYAERVLLPLLKAEGFKAQVVVCGYIADFAHAETRIIVEADGEYHNEPDQKDADQLRDWNLFCQGYKVLRFSNKAIIADPGIVLRSVAENTPSRYSQIPKSNVKGSPRKQVSSRPSVQTATDGLTTVSHENVVSGSADQYTN